MRVTVFVFPELSPFHLSVPSLIFGANRTGIGMPRIDYRVASMDGANTRLQNRLFIEPDGDVKLLAESDIAIIPSWRDLDAPVLPQLADAMHATIRAGGRLVGLCLGTYALAGAGLLDGRAATTHWAWANHFRGRFPRVKLDPNALYLEAGPCLTSAGVAAALDACLHLVRQMSGESVAARLARSVVMAPHRPGGQAQFIEYPIAEDPQGSRLASVLAKISGRIHEHWSLDLAANAAGMTRRSFSRHIRSQNGTTFGDWLTERRIAMACTLLEESKLSIDAVAEATGLGTPENLRAQFSRRRGLSPSLWRAQFTQR